MNTQVMDTVKDTDEHADMDMVKDTEEHVTSP